MSLGKDKGAITKYGGGVLKVVEVNDDGSALSPAGSVEDLGYVDEIGVKRAETGRSKVTDETGNTIKVLRGSIDEGLSGFYLQSNKDLTDFLDAAIDKYYQVYYKMSPTDDVNGKTQELFAGIAQISSAYEIKAKARKPALEIDFLPVESDVTIDTTALTAYGAIASTDVTVAAGTYKTIVENASA